MTKRLSLVASLVAVGVLLLILRDWREAPPALAKGPKCDRPHSFDDLRVRILSVDTRRPRIEIALENRTSQSLWTYQTDDGRCQEPLHQSTADITNEWERTDHFGFMKCIPPMEEKTRWSVVRCAYSQFDRMKFAEFGPPLIVEVPAGATLQREIRWPPKIPRFLIVQVGYGYTKPDFQTWMGGAEWQWARVFEWQHVVASPPFVVPLGR